MSAISANRVSQWHLSSYPVVTGSDDRGPGGGSSCLSTSNRQAICPASVYRLNNIQYLRYRNSQPARVSGLDRGVSPRKPLVKGSSRPRFTSNCQIFKGKELSDVQAVVASHKGRTCLSVICIANENSPSIRSSRAAFSFGGLAFQATQRENEAFLSH
jgi:hypothetical protein